MDSVGTILKIFSDDAYTGRDSYLSPSLMNYKETLVTGKCKLSQSNKNEVASTYLLRRRTSTIE